MKSSAQKSLGMGDPFAEKEIKVGNINIKNNVNKIFSSCP